MFNNRELEYINFSRVFTYVNTLEKSYIYELSSMN